MTRWTFDDIPDQAGRYAIVTGANTGIGFQTARMLALKGAAVTLACRSVAKGRKAVERIKAESPRALVTAEQLDLSDLEHVAAFTGSFTAENERLDLLILNAGVMVPPASRTAQGFELQFGVNHLGHFALAGPLVPLLVATTGSRVVTVSSTAARRGVMDFDDLDFEKRGYSAWQAYGQSKLANQLFTLELQRRLDAAGVGVLATAAHPGWTATDLQRTAPVVRFMNRFVAMQPPRGALPTLRAATDPGAAGGDYFGPDGFLQMRGYPVQIPMMTRARDPEDAARLWGVSEDLTGVSYRFPAPG
jgi:NAD(P)-dependent dehydrogenase (short-subunit alcohol dehydrogenase family)